MTRSSVPVVRLNASKFDWIPHQAQTNRKKIIAREFSALT